jgi:hypothetical protein
MRWWDREPTVALSELSEEELEELATTLRGTTMPSSWYPLDRTAEVMKALVRERQALSEEPCYCQPDQCPRCGAVGR